MLDFYNFCRSAGLLPGEVVSDGKWRRCPTEDHPRKKNGTYKLAENGGIGFCQNFAVHTEPLVWKPYRNNDQPIPHIDRAKIAARMAEDKRKQIRATREARDFYDTCKPLIGSHPYLQGHGLDMAGCYGLRVDALGWLVIPMMIGESLMSVQRIANNGEKLFWPGAPSKNAVYWIERKGASVTVVCEGLATGLAIFASMPMARVVCAFTSGNMRNIALPAGGMVAVAGDWDVGTVCQRHKAEGLKTAFEPFSEKPDWCLCNPGRKAATELADALGCGAAFPIGAAGTDWCDYRNERLSTLMTERQKAREGDLRRAVDAEICAAIMRRAKFVRMVIDKTAV